MNDGEMMQGELVNKYLSFTVGELYAIELDKVTEIASYHSATYVPETPNYIKGVMNLRGKVVPLLDLRTRLGKPPLELAHPCVVIAALPNATVGLIVDSVQGIVTIEPELIMPPSNAPDLEFERTFVSGIGVLDGEMHLILDCDRLVNYEDIGRR